MQDEMILNILSISQLPTPATYDILMKFMQVFDMNPSDLKKAIYDALSKYASQCEMILPRPSSDMFVYITSEVDSGTVYIWNDLICTLYQN